MELGSRRDESYWLMVLADRFEAQVGSLLSIATAEQPSSESRKSCDSNDLSILIIYSIAAQIMTTFD